MIRNKTIKFNMNNEVDRELWEWLQSRPHGEFSEGTKEYWRKEMEDAQIKLERFRTRLNEVQSEQIRMMKEEKK